MANIFLINSGKKFEHSNGQLSETLHNEAKAFLGGMGHTIVETHIDKGYQPKEELDKLVAADIVIHQFPGWWMSYPWITKKWIDEVFMQGAGVIFTSDGRHRVDPTKDYGKGGTQHGKKYMFSTTWNAPIEAFNDPQEFFEGKGIDGVLLHFHKAHQFVGMSGLPTYICNDVMKSPQIDKYIDGYKAHLQKHIGASKK
ncbi:MAG: NAD(P)H-dependent oxidoreductase [Firmicutes bacterium]|nr:NAD(P)H-dependent oxidoreductase [Bacillota bacterium]MCL1953214.1 NAD(P)H-dependent oxidoreductase [Bacillota bacterium]